ncbi:MAG: nitrous oxide-stimulated promoter family protein [Eubacteriales bacterium]|nr:nitrous oxide-stimulated promoter family protein [Eubacteriales bacterium]
MQQTETNKRRLHEKLLLQVMLGLHCQSCGHDRRVTVEDEEIHQWSNHFGRRRFASVQLCEDCRDLLLIGWRHTNNCPRMAEKTFCHHCPKPCYRKADEERIKTVMRQSGRRLLWKHPLLAVCQLRYVWRAKRAASVATERDRQ